MRSPGAVPGELAGRSAAAFDIVFFATRFLRGFFFSTFLTSFFFSGCGQAKHHVSVSGAVDECELRAWRSS